MRFEMHYDDPVQVAREGNSASGYDWSVKFLTDVEPSSTSSRMVVSYNGLVGTLGGDITIEVSYQPRARF